MTRVSVDMSPAILSTSFAPLACCSVAVAASSTSCEVLLMDPTMPVITCSISVTADRVSPCTVSITVAISCVACTDRSARRRTSSATTAKPLPASPARAASIVALSASRFVWSAIPSMTLTILPTSCDRSLIDRNEVCSFSPPAWASSADRRETSSTMCTRLARAEMFSIIRVRVLAAPSTTPTSWSPFWAVCASVALIS